MTTFVHNVDAVFRTTGKTVLVVHHAGHNVERGRGSIVLPSACEGEFFIKKQDNGLILTCDKQKNAAKSEPLYFKFKRITLPNRIDDDGEAVCSLCLELTDGTDKAKNKLLDAVSQNILAALHQAITKHGIEPPNDIRKLFPDSPTKVVHIDDFRPLAYPFLKVAESSKRNTLKRKIKTLEIHNKVMFYSGFLWNVTA